MVRFFRQQKTKLRVVGQHILAIGNNPPPQNGAGKVGGNGISIAGCASVGTSQVGQQEPNGFCHPCDSQGVSTGGLTVAWGGCDTTLEHPWPLVLGWDTTGCLRAWYFPGTATHSFVVGCSFFSGNGAIGLQ